MKKLIFLGLLTLFQGCLNINGHIAEIKGEDGIESIYEATCSVWNEAICIWWKDNPEDPDGYIKEFVKLSYPWWIVDLPCEVVFDTLTFPYDYYKQIKKRKEQ